MPDNTCPVPMDKLEDYRRTIAHKLDGTHEDFEETLHTLEHQHQKRLLNNAWKGETWFKVKADARPPKPTISAPASGKKLAVADKPATAQAGQPTQQLLRRYTGKQPEREEEKQDNRLQQQYPATAVPTPKDTPATADYWIREGHLWKRVHIQP